MKLLKLLANLLLLVSVSGCQTFRMSDWQANITLPASGDCFGFNVMSGKETRIPADSKECKDKKARSIWLDSENYRILRTDILSNCQTAKCKQITGTFDELFLVIDGGLQKIPLK